MDDRINSSLLIHDKRPYVLWRRVSTKGQGKSELGLEAQLAIARVFTKREPAAIFQDVHSGTKLDECEGLWKAIDYCKENNYLLVIAKTDRFRNVRQALEVLEAVGEGNLSFCDMPSVNKFILTIMFAVWESQAMMGRINTKLALEERKKQAEKNGGWTSKAGNWKTHLGNDKGYDMSRAWTASHKASTDRHQEWMETSAGFQFVRRQLMRGRPRKEIIEDFNYNFEHGIQGFATRTGKRLTDATLSNWIKYMGLR